ncbi:MAG TPA: hypothetical protein VK747_04700, partial [Blastocatellia bacterium]|nr:hypothetical protein [Blastocatellia bacterium]
RHGCSTAISGTDSAGYPTTARLLSTGMGFRTLRIASRNDPALQARLLAAPSAFSLSSGCQSLVQGSQYLSFNG